MTYWLDENEIPKKYHLKAGEGRKKQKDEAIADGTSEKYASAPHGTNLIFPETGFGNREICMQLNEAPAGTKSLLHVHNNEWISYIIEGEGIFWVGDQQFEFEEGDAIFVPPNVPHKWKNTGNKTLKMVVFNSCLKSFFPGTQEGSNKEGALNIPMPRAQMLEKDKK